MRKQLTEEQKARREERRGRFRQLWAGIAKMGEAERLAKCASLGIVTCEGHELSLGNTLMVALQLPAASVVGGFRQWLKMGRSVRKGEHGAMIWVPTMRASKDGEAVAASAMPAGEPQEGEDLRFVIGTVFDIGQTDEVENGNSYTPREAVGELVAA